MNAFSVIAILGGLILTGFMLFASVEFHASLNNIHRDLALIAENTHQPVQIGIAGFSPEAATAIDQALDPKEKIIPPKQKAKGK